MDNVIKLLNSNPDFENEVMISSIGLTKIERLQKEVSKKRITFKNGSIIEIKTTDEKSKGEAILGFGYDFTCVDESPLIGSEAWSKVYRMLLENPKGIILEIGNPYYLNHFHEHHNNPDWEKIHIHWEDCVREGRFTLDQVEEQRKELSPDKFRILLEAEFPLNITDCVYTDQDIMNATEQTEMQEIIKYSIGVDVARGGRDSSVITITGKDINGIVYYVGSKTLRTNDIMHLVGAVRTIYDKYVQLADISIVIDVIGVGGGVFDRLKELELQPIQFIAGGKPQKSNLYFNLKSETAFNLKKTMRDGLFKNLPVASNYAFELRKITSEIKSDKTEKINDPTDKSPDYFDSLLYSYYGQLDIGGAEFTGLEW